MFRKEHLRFAQFFFFYFFVSFSHVFKFCVFIFFFASPTRPTCQQQGRQKVNTCAAKILRLFEVQVSARNIASCHISKWGFTSKRELGTLSFESFHGRIHCPARLTTGSTYSSFVELLAFGRISNFSSYVIEHAKCFPNSSACWVLKRYQILKCKIFKIVSSFQENILNQEQLLRELDMYQEIAVAKGPMYEHLNRKMDRCQDNIESLSDEIQRLQGRINFCLDFLKFQPFILRERP